MRYTDAELSLIKNSFAENEELLKAMRKVFLQLPLSEADEIAIRGNFGGKQGIKDLLRKTFMPELDGNAPFGQLIDLWMSVDVKEKPLEDMMPVFKARQLLIELLEQQLVSMDSLSEGKEVKEKIKIADLTELKTRTVDKFYTNVIARNTLITHVDSQLMQLEALAGLKDETLEQTLERLKKDSSR